MTTRKYTSVTPLRRWLETAAITLGGPAAGWALHWADPFFVQARSPWLTLLPLLCGAQYGMAHGVASAALLSGLAFVHVAGSGHATWVAVSNWSLGCLIVGALVGQFRDVAQRRRATLTETLQHASEALARAQRSAHILQLSHARLEERLAASRWSLASSLDGAVRRMQDLWSQRELGEVLLDVLASQATVQSASLFWAGSAELEHEPIASLGEKRSSTRLNPLVMRAQQTGRLVAVGDSAMPRAGDASEVLAAVPLLTSTGQLVGVVAIHQMSFIAFQAEHLRSLLVIASQLADLMNDRLQELFDVSLEPIMEQLSRSLELSFARPHPSTLAQSMFEPGN